MGIRNLLLTVTVLFLAVGIYLYNNIYGLKIPQDMADKQIDNIVMKSPDIHPLQIAEMRKGKYPGSDITVSQTLAPGSNFKRYIASYLSDGLTIKGLLAVPNGEKPENGWPAIVFNHGYIRPEEYGREAKYVAYIAGFASRGYIVFMPDYRGHQDSDGEPEGAYFSPAYATDSLNAFYSLAKYSDVDPENMGMWGHSMGGNVTIRSMVVSKDVKVGVIWAGVVASYDDMANKWRRTIRWNPSTRENMSDRPSRADLEKQFGTASENPEFWKSISPIYFVSDISGPVQLHHGLADDSVPWEFSESLKIALEAEKKTVEYFTYENADHNIAGSAFTPAMKRSVDFFDKYLK